MGTAVVSSAEVADPSGTSVRASTRSSPAAPSPCVPLAWQASSEWSADSCSGPPPSPRATTRCRTSPWTATGECDAGFTDAPAERTALEWDLDADQIGEGSVGRRAGGREQHPPVRRPYAARRSGSATDPVGTMTCRNSSRELMRMDRGGMARVRVSRRPVRRIAARRRRATWRLRNAAAMVRPAAPATGRSTMVRLPGCVATVASAPADRPRVRPADSAVRPAARPPGGRPDARRCAPWVGVGGRGGGVPPSVAGTSDRWVRVFIRTNVRPRSDGTCVRSARCVAARSIRTHDALRVVLGWRFGAVGQEIGVNGL